MEGANIVPGLADCKLPIISTGAECKSYRYIKTLSATGLYYE